MLNSFFYTAWVVLSIIVGYNLVLPTLFFLIYKIVRKKKYEVPFDVEPDYAIIVTAYEDINTLGQAILSLLNLKYTNFLIYVVADKCDVSGLHIHDERVIILKPEKELRSNTASHLYAFNHFKRAHKFVTIIDSDNLTHPQYLNQLNPFFKSGFLAVQGVRKAKNLNSLYACLDAAQDIYYHFYDREILFAIGSSATLAGSGMAFEANYYYQFLKQYAVKGAGFDKKLQLKILSDRYRIAFAKHAIVYDEKTSKSDQLVKQRARWFNTWFKYAGSGFRLIGQSVYKPNWNQFLFALMFLRPPLFLVVMTSSFMLAGSFFIDIVSWFYWLGAFLLFIIALVLAMIQTKADAKIYKSFVGIPVFMFYQILSLLKIKRANKISVATPHYYTKSIEDVAENHSKL